MNKIKQYFRDTADKVKTSVRVNKEIPFFYISLILIVVLAILVRLSPVVQGTFLIKAFDPHYQFDSFKQLLDMGVYDWLHFHDYKFWYPEGVDRFDLRPGLLFAAAFVYLLLTGLGIGVTYFQVAFYFPALMGGLTVLVIYFLGKEILDRRAGLLAAFFLAFSPGHMQRTVAGFFDNETVGVFAVLLTLLFFIKALKYGKISDGIWAGLSLGFLALSWGGLTYVFLLLPILVIILILANKYNVKVFMAYSLTICIGLLIFIINPSFKWSVMMDEMDFIVPLLFQGFLVVYHLLYMQKESGIYDKVLRWIKWAAVPAALIFAIIFWTAPQILPFGLSGRLGSILNPNIRDTFNLVASVGEHAPSPWSVFYFNSLIPLLLIVPGMYFAIRRGKIEDILMVIFIVTLFYFTGSMIRIILLFAPAIALLGAYALSNILKHVGNLMKKQQNITRRRKRQLKRTLGVSEAVVVYSFIGILLFVQASHAIDISAEQLPYADIETLGAFHDWEETLTWMKQNLPGTSVMVSWWDYGYWISSVGNTTTVNDNGTWNQTRIGLTGMAMMQTDERASAEIFQALHADYVLVYFGHLHSSFGGDEGKWPWMLRICNDNTKRYEAMPNIPKDNWYGENDQVSTVFDEDEYVNSTDGRYYNNWFDSTLVKLMFAGEITASSQVPENAPFPVTYLPGQLEGNPSAGINPLTDGYGNLWTSHDTVNGQYELQFFTPTYFSLNRLVKIYKVDYSALGSFVEVNETHLDTDGFGSAVITNTGDNDLTVSGVALDDGSLVQSMNYTLEDSANPTFQPGESRHVWFDSNEIEHAPWTTDDNFTIEVEANADGFIFTNTSVSQDLQIPEEASIAIDRENTRIEVEDGKTNAYLSVINEGAYPTKVANISINGNWLPETAWQNDLNPNYLIASGASESFTIKDLGISYSTDFDTDVSIQVLTARGTEANTLTSFNQPGFSLHISPTSLEGLPEDGYLFDYDTYQDLSAPTGQYYMGYNTESYLLENGTLQLRVENSGESLLALQNIYADEISYENFDVIADHNFEPGYEKFIDPGDYRTIRVTVADVELNTPMKIIMTAMHDTTVASDSAYFVPRNQTQMISIIDTDDSLTTAFANETLRLIIKNVGSEVVTLDSVTINDTETVELTSDMVVDGALTLNPNEIAHLQVPFEQIKLNLTNSVDLTVNTTENVHAQSSILTARLPTLDTIFDLEPSTNPFDHWEYPACSIIKDLNKIHLMLSLEHNQTITLDGIYMKTDGDYQYIPWSTNVTVTDNENPANDITDRILTGAESGNSALFYLDILGYTADLTVGEIVWIKIITAEGYEAEIALTVES
ncbi:MAG: STT3 domain-containing protein [Promethearchaeota archaeon]